jgi:hypothetical protein
LKSTKWACDYGAQGRTTPMRFLIVAAASVSALAFASGATAQRAPPFCTRDFARRHRAPAFAVVYRTQYLQAVPGQCCTCRRASHLPWLPHGVPGALLDLCSHRCLRRRCVLIATIVRLEAAANAKPKVARWVERSSRGARRSVARADVRPTRCREDLPRW